MGIANKTGMLLIVVLLLRSYRYGIVTAHRTRALRCRWCDGQSLAA